MLIDFLTNNVNHITTVLAAAGAFIIAYLSIPIVIRVSHAKHLFDDPSDVRKLHTKVTPNLGGVSIFAALLIPFLLSSMAFETWSPYLTAGLIAIFFSGLKDDIVILSAWKKLSLQLLAIGALVLGGNMVITDLGGMFGINEVSYQVGLLLTIFTMVVVVNSYNLIDGIDGLAGGVGVIVSLFFGIWFWMAGLHAETVLAFSLTGALLAFLIYNFEPASIFMGDTGSQVVGFVLAFLAVRFVDFGVTSAEALPFQNEIPALILAVFIVPLYDTLRVFGLRVLNGNSPFNPDRLHVHHQLLDMGFSHRAACIIIYSVNLIIISMAMLMSGLNVNIIFAAVLGAAIVLFPTDSFKRRIFEYVGIQVPSAREIAVLKERLGLKEKTIGKESEIITSGISNGNSTQHSKHELEKEELSAV